MLENRERHRVRRNFSERLCASDDHLYSSRREPAGAEFHGQLAVAAGIRGLVSL